MNFFKQNSYYIMRLFVTHLGMAVFGTVMLMSTVNRSSTLMLAAGIFAALFYGTLVYATMWEAGAKDKNAIDARRFSLKKSKGFLIALTAQSLVIFLVLVFFICSVLMAQTDIAKTIYGICYLILLLLDGSFTGIMLFVRNIVNSDLVVAAVYLIGSVFISFAGMLGYTLGTKEFHFLPQKKKSEQPTRKD